MDLLVSFVRVYDLKVSLLCFLESIIAFVIFKIINDTRIASIIRIIVEFHENKLSIFIDVFINIFSFTRFKSIIQLSIIPKIKIINTTILPIIFIFLIKNQPM